MRRNYAVRQTIFSHPTPIPPPLRSPHTSLKWSFHQVTWVKCTSTHAIFHQKIVYPSYCSTIIILSRLTLTSGPTLTTYISMSSLLTLRASKVTRCSSISAALSTTNMATSDEPLRSPLLSLNTALRSLYNAPKRI